MLDNEYKLKLLDFGFSSCKIGKTGDGLLSTYLGTPTYMAPEIHAGMAYKGEAVDVFASGVLLFIMLTGRPPFKNAKPSDPYYKYISQGANDKFWMIHSKSLPGGEKFFSVDFKDLLNSMLAVDSDKRIKFVDIATHPWLKGATTDDKSRIAEFQQRHKILDDIAARNSQVQMTSSPTVPVGAFRADDPVFQKQLAECEKKPLLEFYQYDSSVSNPCNFYTKYNPNFIILKLRECAEKLLHPIKIAIHDKKYKLKINLAGEYKQYCVTFKISKRNDKSYFIEVTKSREGDKNDFTNMYTRMFNTDNKDSASSLRTITA
jgi:serine/threonine protein kinase